VIIYICIKIYKEKRGYTKRNVKCNDVVGNVTDYVTLLIRTLLRKITNRPEFAQPQTWQLKILRDKRFAISGAVAAFEKEVQRFLNKTNFVPVA